MVPSVLRDQQYMFGVKTRLLLVENVLMKNDLKADYAINSQHRF